MSKFSDGMIWNNIILPNIWEFHVIHENLKIGQNSKDDTLIILEQYWNNE